METARYRRSIVRWVAMGGGPFRRLIFSRTVWLWALLAGVVVGLFHDSLWPHRVFAYRDAAHFYPPLYRLVADEWLAGRVPLWNPLLNGGQPLAGMATSGAFYPPQILLTLLLPDGTSLNAYAILHLLFAAIGAFQLARAQNLSRQAATLAGLAYAFCGSVVFQVYNPIFAAGAAWMVWAILGGWRLVHGGGPADFLLLAVSLAMSVLCGDPQAGYHAGLLLGLAVLLSGLARRRNLGLLACAAVLAGLLSLVQITQAAEYTRDTARAMDLAPQSVWQIPEFFSRVDQSPDRANWYDIFIGRAPKVARQYRTSYGFSLAPWRVAELVWPGFSGSFHSRWTLAAGIEPDAVWVFSLYGGIVTLLLAALAVGASRRGPTGFWTLVAVVSLVTSIGAYCGIGVIRNVVVLVAGPWRDLGYRPGDEVGSLYWLWMTFLPGYTGFRYPSKWLTLFALAVGQLAAFGADRLGEPSSRRILRRLAVAVGSVLVLAVAGLGLAGLLRGVVHVLPVSESRSADPRDFWLMMAGGVQSVILCCAVWLFAGGRARSPIGLVAITAIDLVLAGRRDVVVADYRDFIAGGDFLEALQERRRPELAESSPRLRIAATGSGGSLVSSRDAARYLRALGMTMTAHAPWPHGVEKIAEASTAMQADADLLFKPFQRDGRSVVPRRAFDLAGAEFFIVSNERAVLDKSEGLALDWSPDQKKGVLSGMEPSGPPMPMLDILLPGGDASRPLVYVIRNESALPRARIVRDARGVPAVSKKNWDRWIDLLKRIAFPNADLPELFDTILLEGDGRDLGRVAGPSAAGERGAVLPGGLADSCRIVVDEPQRVVVEATLSDAGFVVLADSFHADWTLGVSTDGGPPAAVPILRANRLHRACLLPAGRHRLEFTYRSESFTRAGWVTGLAWSAVGLIGVPAIRSWRRPHKRHAA
jgi:hypothetical protein